MPDSRTIERKWIENFKRCALVDQETGSFISAYANQLFYGKLDDSYPADYPHNFTQFYSQFQKLNREAAIDELLTFLHFAGILIKKENIQQHLDKYPNDFIKITGKCRYIFKALAHYDATLNINNPYRDNPGDILFLSRIEAGESTKGGQLNLFEDMELPDLYRRLSQLPDNYGDDEISMDLFRNVENTNDSFFITGKAGTGKSTFIHYFTKNTHKKVLMMAFTGIAAMNIGGQTIHSFFRFPLKPLLPEDHEIKIFTKSSQQYKIIEKIDTIVIDEVSMLRSDILEAIDFSLRQNGGNPRKIFGGKQLLFVGDIFQLPPVLSEAIEGIRFNELYRSEYFFDAHSYKKLAAKYFEFKISHRQKDDIPFIRLLDKVRVCEVDNATLALLNERYDPGYVPRIDEFVINLTANNAIANAENAYRLRELPYTQLPAFEAVITGEFPESKYPTGKTLELKKNAQIIFIKNDTGKKWVNGTIAKIDFITKEFIEVRLQDGSIHQLEKETWENRKYTYDKDRKRIVSTILGTFEQYPVKLAWAITIHKSQGLTFDNVIIDLGRGAFINGQVYTALSRCRTLNGITLKQKLRREDIIADQRIIQFHYTEQLIHELDDADEVDM